MIVCELNFTSWFSKYLQWGENDVIFQSYSLKSSLIRYIILSLNPSWILDFLEISFRAHHCTYTVHSRFITLVLPTLRFWNSHSIKSNWELKCYFPRIIKVRLHNKFYKSVQGSKTVQQLKIRYLCECVMLDLVGTWIHVEHVQTRLFILLCVHNCFWM